VPAFSALRFSQYSRDLERSVLDLSREKRMGIKLQGIAAKVAKLEHDAEFEAAKLDAKIEEVSGRMPAIFSGAHGHVDKLAKNVGDIESAFDAVAAVTNGAPADEPAAPLPVAGPYPTYP
jgi:hypothetical protein